MRKRKRGNNNIILIRCGKKRNKVERLRRYQELIRGRKIAREYNLIKENTEEKERNEEEERKISSGKYVEEKCVLMMRFCFLTLTFDILHYHCDENQNQRKIQTWNFSFQHQKYFDVEFSYLRFSFEMSESTNSNKLKKIF